MILEYLKKKNKKKYISTMYNIFHKNLYNYQKLLKNTLINKIIITSQDVYFDIKDSINKKVLNQQKLIRIKGIERDHRIFPLEMINFGRYEDKEISVTLKIVDKLLRKKKTIFFDIGANIGFYSLKLYQKFSAYKKKLNIYAFEPIKSTYKYLNENVNINTIKNSHNSKIFTRNFGFSNEKKVKKLHFYPEGSGNASLKKLNNYKTKLVQCEFTTVDHFTKKNRVIPDFIKIDVEGMELLVLHGAKDLIKKHKPIFLLEILNKFSKKYNYSPNEIFNFLYKNNYSSYILTSKKNKSLTGGIKKFSYMNKKTPQTNFLFLCNSKHYNIKNFLLYNNR